MTSLENTKLSHITSLTSQVFIHEVPTFAPMIPPVTHDTKISRHNIGKTQFRNTLIYIILSGETFQQQICQPCKTSPSRNSSSRSRHYRA